MEKFDKVKYDMEYKKLHKRKFAVDLNIEELNKLEEVLKSLHITKTSFLRNSIERFYKENNIK